MRVKRMSVKGLFGVFDHDIPLENADRVTIIHGPNGFGKTVMLRMIATVAGGTDAHVFEHTPFSEFRLTMDDGTGRIVRRSEEKSQSGRSKIKLEFLNEDENGNTVAVDPVAPFSEIPRAILSEIDKLIPAPYRLSPSGWLDDSGNEFSLAQILSRFPDARAGVPAKYRPKLFQDDLQAFFVETNRLRSEVQSEAPSMRNVLYARQLQFATEQTRSISTRVQQYSEDISQRIRTVLANYGKHSQERDRTYPERLVRFVRDGYRALSEREILGQMEELENKRKRLITLGLLDSESGLRDLTEEDMRRALEALTIYVGDVQEKLKVFDDLSHRIGSLMDIVNDRFRYKRLRVDREKGFRVISDLGQVIELEDLSSGEQHELVVLYELLFRAPKNGLVLVDEPEISLHVAWQSRFLSDLIGILALTDAYAIVATHSPVIIGTRSDLTVELKGPAASE